MAFPTLHYYGDGGTYGNGDLYNDFVETGLPHVAEREVQCHRLSVRLMFTPSLSLGSYGGFRIHSVRPRLSPISQKSFTHEAFIDRVTPSNRISVKIHHTGSEFILSHVQLIAHRKKHQPIL